MKSFLPLLLLAPLATLAADRPNVVLILADDLGVIIKTQDFADKLARRVEARYGERVDVKDIIEALQPRGFGFVPPVGIRPTVGRSPRIPFMYAGQRTDPATSLPWATWHMPVATATPAPPLDPPQLMSSRCGLSVTKSGNRGSMFCNRFIQ